MSNQLFLIDAPTWAGDRDVLMAGNRSQRITFDLLDRKNRTLDALRGVSRFSMSCNVNATVRTGGSLTYQGPPIDWMSHRVRATYTATAYGRSVSWPLGTFIPAAPDTQYRSSGVLARDLQIYDMMHLLDIQASTAGSYVVPAGANVTDRIRLLLSRAGYQLALEDSPHTLRTAMSWPAGTRYLQIVNELLEAINYFSIHADPYGVFRAAPYQAPTTRGTTFTFRDDGQSILAPDLGHTYDTYDVPNQVTVTTNIEGEEPPLTAVATDTTSRFSYEQRGIRVNRHYEGVDAPDQATLNAIATRRLTDAQQPLSTYTIRHLPIPLQLNDVVRLARTRHGIDVLTVVQQTTITMGQALAETVLREVAA